jgi:hypothetical protein
LNKIVSTKNTSAIFLATVLLAGTIALSSPSFMTNVSAQSESYYGMDNNNYKSQYGQDKYKTKDNVVVKKINCNNVNVNVNGLELNGLPPFLGNLLASDGQDGYGGASSYGSGSYGDGQQSGYDKNNNSFKFVCINNNNNTVVVEEEPVPPVDECSEAEEIEACFEEFLFEEGDFPRLVAALESGITVEINGEEVTLRSFADIYLVLESVTTYDEIISALFTILSEVTPPIRILPSELTDCIDEALDIPIPPIET